MSLKPEEQARIKIDEMLERAGWSVVSRDEYSERDNAIAVEDGLLVGNKEADYLLFLDGKAIGVLEAKRQESSLGLFVSEQAVSYSARATDWYQTWQKPLPFIYKSNGDKLLFDLREQKNGEPPEFVELKKMHTPKELAKSAELHSEFACLPPLAEQKRIVARIEEFFAEFDAMEKGM